MSLTVFEMGSLTFAEGRRAAEQLVELPRSRRPTAVFCANDLLALGMLQELIRRGIRVPDDVAIVGYDDIDYAAAAAIPLSSVRQPREQLGRTAAELLFDEINDGDIHRHRRIRFRPELIIRESSSPNGQRSAETNAARVSA
jgi:DNA-binding LacI/PurR family transcriptional regulator